MTYDLMLIHTLVSGQNRESLPVFYLPGSDVPSLGVSRVLWSLERVSLTSAVYCSLPCGHPACQGCVFVNNGATFCSTCGGSVEGVPKFELFLRSAALAVLDLYGLNIPHRTSWYDQTSVPWVESAADNKGGEPVPSGSTA